MAQPEPQQPVATPGVEVPDAPIDAGASVGQWVAAGAVGLVLALVAGLVLRRALMPQALPLGASIEADTQAPPPQAPPGSVPGAPAPAATGMTSRLLAALSRTGDAFRGLFGRPVDAALLSDLEDALLVADVGMPTAQRLIERVRAEASGDVGTDVLREALRGEMHAILDAVDPSLDPGDHAPWVVMVVGVNGSGKTTTIGKLAARLGSQGRKVMIAAADTYRAAAADQLAVWAERAGADIVRHAEGADPGAVTFDALDAARARGCDVVLIDTAGRLQTRKPLMEQLTKIRRVIAKSVPDGPHETLLVIDGTMGQNALSQARLFHEATPLTGVVVTKLDGTAKGGVVLAVAAEMGIPVKLVGVGEKVDDLRDFSPEAFVAAIVGPNSAERDTMSAEAG